MSPARIVLAGGGHAHLAVLRALAAVDAAVTLVQPTPLAVYSGMVPAVLAGDYPRAAAEIDIARLAAATGARLRLARVVSVDARGRTVRLHDGEQLPYDLLSLDVGGQPIGWPDDVEQTGVARVKPIHRALDEIEAGLHRLVGEHAVVVVVGGGAGGVELAFALATRLRGRGRVTLCTASQRVVPSHSPRTAALIQRALARAGIGLRTAAPVTAVAGGAVCLANGDRLPADLIVWATGSRGPAWLGACGLPVDTRGCLQVDDQLRCREHPQIFAAGDCASLHSHPDLPKAGVYAVRQGAVLAHNLIAALRGHPMRSFRPRARVLSLINTGDGSAILSYGRLALHARAAWWLKDRIDQRFVAHWRV